MAIYVMKVTTIKGNLLSNKVFDLKPQSDVQTLTIRRIVGGDRQDSVLVVVFQRRKISIKKAFVS